MIQLYIHIFTHFQTLLSYRLLQIIEYSSLCYTVGTLGLLLLYILVVDVGFPSSTVVKNHLPMQETQEKWVQSLGQEDPLEQEIETHSSILTWKIPWMEGPGGLQSMESRRVRHNSRVCLSQAPKVSLPQHFSSGNHKLVFDIHKSVCIL